MTATTPCIITVAITGSLPTKKDNPAVPITVAEQVESTQGAFADEPPSAFAGTPEQGKIGGK
jgi:hypothetical protein